MPSAVLTASEIARQLGISLATFYLHVRPSLPAVRIGRTVRYAPADVEAFQNARRAVDVRESSASAPLAVASESKVRPAAPAGRHGVAAIGAPVAAENAAGVQSLRELRKRLKESHRGPK